MIHHGNVLYSLQSHTKKSPLNRTALLYSFAVANCTCVQHISHKAIEINMTTSTIIFRVSKFERDPIEPLPSHFVTLYIKNTSFDKDIDWLITSLTDKSNWKTLVENSSIYFPELAEENGSIKLAFIGMISFFSYK